jgi:sodium/potassium/calcium exchanger 6
MCSYILAHTPCAPAGYIDYLRLFFYCGFGAAPAAVGYTAVLLWLVLLFYLIGDTASESFYASLESLSARRGRGHAPLARQWRAGRLR